MKFVVSSSELLGRLQSVSRVIASKNTLPILDNFLFDLSGNSLTITASDLETTLRTTMTLDNVMEQGSVAIPARILTDSLKEFPEQPLTFTFNKEQNIIEFTWSTGKFQVPGFPAEDYPISKEPSDSLSITFSPDVLLEGINRTLFAAGDEELRPVMNGIFFDLKKEAANLVASDSHKLVCYTRTDIKATEDSSFILPKKPANILKNLLVKINDDVTVAYDKTNAFFTFGSYQMVCRLVEGNYPAYRSVIPQNNPNNIVVDRIELMNAVRRVSVCSNQATNLIKLLFSANQIFVSAQDIEFRIAAQERISCQYDGPAIEMGFKSIFLAEILANLPGTDTNIALSDPSRVGLITPVTTDSENEEICALIMPMMITQ
ncbi:MAG TPA: DNA polymerase III subunit beta [Bacteroidales bacterium]|nr:DNA polymerase III subunit beta [Bacteroidales bacterium]HPW78379.1 DNA polymerase III subunit beta [Bacteroidales bacterium]HQB55974.1 DNA polymerase III subunit beta [Bacteroidales bacterium]